MAQQIDGLIKNFAIRRVQIFEVWDSTNTPTPTIHVSSISGDSIFIQPTKNKCFIVQSYHGTNEYNKAQWITGTTKIVISEHQGSHTLSVLDTSDGSVETVNTQPITTWGVNWARNLSLFSYYSPHYISASDDVYMYFGNIRYRSSIPLYRMNKNTLEVELMQDSTVPSASAIWPRLDMRAVKIDNSPYSDLDGLYVYWPVDDSYNFILEDFEDQADSVGTYDRDRQLLVHWDDRNSDRTKMRTMLRIDGTIKIVDLLTYDNTSSTEWIDTKINNTNRLWFLGLNDTSLWENSAGSSASSTNASQDLLPEYASEYSIDIPVDATLSYGYYIPWGEILVAGLNYSHNKDNFYSYALNKSDGSLLWIDSFDPLIGMANNGTLVNYAIVDFNGEHNTYGYHSGENQVVFFRRGDRGSTQTIGFINLSNGQFVDYNYDTNPNNWSINIFNPFDYKDSNYDANYGFGLHANSGTSPIIDLEDEEIYVSENGANTISGKVNAILYSDIVQKLDLNYKKCDVTFKVGIDPDKLNRYREITIPNLTTTEGKIGAINFKDNGDIFLNGIVYSGSVLLDSSKNPIFSFGGGVSMRGTEKVTSNKYIVYGYLGRIEFFDLSTNSKVLLKGSDINAINVQISTSSLSENQSLCLGFLARNASYKYTYGRVLLIDHTNFLNPFTENITLPMDFDYIRINNLRNAIGLTGDSYTTIEADALISSYASSNSKTVNQVIQELKDLGDQRCEEIVNWVDTDTYVLFSTYNDGYAGLRDFNVTDEQGNLIGAFDDKDSSIPKMLIYKGNNDMKQAQLTDYNWINLPFSAGIHKKYRVNVTDNYILLTTNIEDYVQEQFSGNSVVKSFTTSKDILFNTHVTVYVNEVLQVITTDYTINGNQITFTNAPASGEIIKINFNSYSFLAAINKANIDTYISTGTFTFDKVLYIPIVPYADSQIAITGYGWGTGGNNSSTTQGNKFCEIDGDDAYFRINKYSSYGNEKVIKVDLSQPSLTVDSIAEGAISNGTISKNGNMLYFSSGSELNELDLINDTIPYIL